MIRFHDILIIYACIMLVEWKQFIPQTLVITSTTVIYQDEKVKWKQWSECENHSFNNELIH